MHKKTEGGKDKKNGKKGKGEANVIISSQGEQVKMAKVRKAGGIKLKTCSIRFLPKTNVTESNNDKILTK